MSLFEIVFPMGYVIVKGINQELWRIGYMKTIVTDLDRTLLRTDKTISEGTLDVLKKM